MPRVGVNYETIKHTALKLLSQGASPSVQKVREVLGTGSNTTIAEHLKVWREEHANKAIHHLPANMPKALVSAIEVLWQTAMEQAAKQLESIKHQLTASQEKLRLDKVAMDTSENELRHRMAEAQKIMDNQTAQINTLQTALAVLEEKSKQQTDEHQTIKQQYEARLQREYEEKNNEKRANQQVKAEIVQLKHQLNETTEKHLRMRNEERALQESSEKRWCKLIDQARTETTAQRKRFENTVNKQSNQLEKLQIIVSESQKKQITQQSLLNRKNERISEISEQYNQQQARNQTAITTIAELQERINHLNSKQKKLKSKNQSKMVRQS